jgi:hypothetical protein
VKTLTRGRTAHGGEAGRAESDTSALERKIDELVYALYGLTKAEKDIVKAAAK